MRRGKDRRNAAAAMNAERRSARPPPRRLRRHPSSFEEGKAKAPIELTASPFPSPPHLEEGCPRSGRGGPALSLCRTKLGRHPVGGLVAVTVPEVVDDGVAAFDHREHAGTRDRRGELLRLRV